MKDNEAIDYLISTHGERTAIEILQAISAPDIVHAARRSVEVAIARRLMASGTPRRDVAERLQSRGLSRTVAYRRIATALYGAPLL